MDGSTVTIGDVEQLPMDTSYPFENERGGPASQRSCVLGTVIASPLDTRGTCLLGIGMGLIVDRGTG
jgi:hypothetical protein